MNSRQIIDITKFVFWLLFIGLLIKTGTTIVTTVMSLMDGNTFGKEIHIDNYVFTNNTRWEFIKITSLLIAIQLMECYLVYLAIQIAIKGNIKHPFTATVGKLISDASYTSLSIGIIAVVATWYCKHIAPKSIVIPAYWSAKEYLLLAAVIFIISKVFNRGMALQQENDLTI